MSLEVKTQLKELERKESQLEMSVGETRKIVEDVRMRLDSVERWIAEREQKENCEMRKRQSSADRHEIKASVSRRGEIAESGLKTSLHLTDRILPISSIGASFAV